mmetsp:Transcript_101133/g.261361  ORF Transcript_101133/g.261361 Transcript_101133/m.261361 type:complete len:231 (+) Transcript_101133:271-963(+)
MVHWKGWPRLPLDKCNSPSAGGAGGAGGGAGAASGASCSAASSPSGLGPLSIRTGTIGMAHLGKTAALLRVGEASRVRHPRPRLGIPRFSSTKVLDRTSCSAGLAASWHCLSAPASCFLGVGILSLSALAWTGTGCPAREEPHLGVDASSLPEPPAPLWNRTRGSATGKPSLGLGVGASSLRVWPRAGAAVWAMAKPALGVGTSPSWSKPPRWTGSASLSGSARGGHETR